MEHIQMDEARRLSAEWGNKPCNHNVPLYKEYYLGTNTGDLICSQCGAAADRATWDNMRKEQS